MDDATRARLESIHDRLGLRIWDVEARKDVEAVAAMLAAYDTLLAERAQAQADLAAWREGRVDVMHDWRNRCLAAEAARTQAAPVLAAAEAWYDAMETDDGSVEASCIWHDALETLADAVNAWRAAREGG